MYRFNLKVALIACLAYCSSIANAVELKGTIWEKASVPGVDPALLYAVALVETRKARDDGLAAPRPYILRAGSRVIEFPTYDKAARHLTRIMAQDVPAHTLDIGMMQINPKWHGHRVEHLSDFLIPSIAIRVASEILQEAMSSTDDTVIGIGRYHSYTNNKALRYGSDVVHIACRIGWKNDACSRILAQNDMGATAQ